MTYHKLISDKITTFLDNVYYNTLSKIYKKDLNELFLDKSIPIFIPEYYIFLQNYYIYNFFYYLNNDNFIMNSISLHIYHICGHIFKNVTLNYNYTPAYNINLLKDINYILFNYLLLLKLLFINKNIYAKTFLLVSISLFNMLSNINYIYRKRIKSIDEKKDLNHFYKFLIITPNKNIMEKIVHNTRFFNYSTFLIFLNFIFYIFLYN
jgi:hypothetical protein